MTKNLVIVESPAKAKTIEGYLGKDFTVRSSFGHVRDLPEKGIAIDVKNHFRPTYEINDDKKDLVNQLQQLAADAEVVWLATDDDREGEAISWHLKEALNLQENKTKRIVFREITKNAILNAIQSPRSLDLDLVNAQQARRILDRLVGYELSPVLWKKIKTGLSAGRVQSVAVRLIVEREREIEGFETKSSYKVSALFQVEKGKTLVAELPKNFDTEADALDFLNRCLNGVFKIKNLETKPAKRTPAPPFTTSTLQQEASRKLYFSVSKTMMIAQKLYESGKITYMRTDSTNLSEEALTKAATEITNSFGKQYLQTRRFKTKSDSAQEAHEAIRPTDFSVSSINDSRDEQRLYELIWKRAIASQMADAQLERTTATISINSPANGVLKEELIATGEVIKFDGFLRVYIESTDEDDEENKAMLPPLTIGQQLQLDNMKAVQRFSRPAARYTEASLVKKLEELGIGRPSTYAPTVSTVQQRGYVVKEDRDGKERSYREITLKNNSISTDSKKEIFGAEKAKLFPTDVAMIVNDFLVQYFPDVIDFKFTATVEKDFDEIAQGRMIWEEMLEKFYDGFHRKIENTDEIQRSSVGKSRSLGTHPETGEPVSVKLGKFGPYVQIGEMEDDVKPRFASLKKGQFMERLSLEEALELFKLPREIGSYEDKVMKVAIGKFGPYIQHDGKYYSLGKEDDPYSIDDERAIVIIQAKRKSDAEKSIKEFPGNPDVRILNGRFGPYIAIGKQNIKIPKSKDPKSLTLEECLELAKEADSKPKTGRFAKKGAAAKTTTKAATKTTKAAGEKSTSKKSTKTKK
ncbi:type I DNA topoisomerase [Xanthocytophaga agilis]|uniref:DNA topoisomerase 1 n=1 Tax=Xanthocytophaga agilis TaxID=3048010 RepID=A0AAE3UD58_9BACT|nr:type I DNA topoisomerase [Xanthocytophaga agilis]MDJ1499996.1 type I DNA topoisomerase [Xanthocytophaga agilis]